MKSSSLTTAAPILVITVGVGWLLTTKNVIPGVDWVWVLGLGGIDKLTVVVGPFLIISTVFSLLRQTDRISENTEIPSLVIVAGVLMFISRLLRLPPPRWLDEEDRDVDQG